MNLHNESNNSFNECVVIEGTCQMKTGATRKTIIENSLSQKEAQKLFMHSSHCDAQCHSCGLFIEDPYQSSDA